MTPFREQPLSELRDVPCMKLQFLIEQPLFQSQEDALMPRIGWLFVQRREEKSRSAIGAMAHADSHERQIFDATRFAPSVKRFAIDLTDGVAH